MTEAALKIENLSKHFGGLQALNGISLSVFPGEILGLIGPNGSGKTTCFNIVSGMQKPDSGKVWYQNSEISNQAPHIIARRKIGRTFQNPRVLAESTVLENTLVGSHVIEEAGLASTLFRSPSYLKGRRKALELAMAALEFVGLEGNINGYASSLPYGKIKRLELARAMCMEPDLLLLDEPAAGLNAEEADELMALIGRLRTSGKTVMLVEHNMHLVMSLCTRIVVAQSGEIIAEGGPKEVQRNPKVVEAYLGPSE